MLNTLLIVFVLIILNFTDDLQKCKNNSAGVFSHNTDRERPTG